MPVHVGGLMLDVAAVQALADEHGLWVVEDAAHAFPASWRRSPSAPWQRCGDATSAISCFSFYANKTITTGEGGMATTSDEALADRMRLMSLHGLSQDAWRRYSGGSKWDYRIQAPGFKYNLTDVAAAIGIHQLARAEEMRVEREAIARPSRGRAVAGRGARAPPASTDRIHSWHLFPIRLRLDRISIDRNAFIDNLKAVRASAAPCTGGRCTCTRTTRRRSAGARRICRRRQGVGAPGQPADLPGHARGGDRAGRGGRARPLPRQPEVGRVRGLVTGASVGAAGAAGTEGPPRRGLARPGRDRARRRGSRRRGAGARDRRCAVAATTGLPVFFRQVRVGRHGRPFTLIKLRTMRNARAGSAGPQVTAGNDPRITAVGRFLRRTKLDELPELWNVLRGDMSFVGPRPEVADYVHPEEPLWREVLSVRPGFDGPGDAPVEARGGAPWRRCPATVKSTTGETLQPRKLEGYVEYLRRRTWRSDLGVLFATAGAIFRPRRADRELEEARGGGFPDLKNGG
jgi:lipopolysaccharide/colanic/teichoic acid biosynthesis glycosyltransferase